MKLTRVGLRPVDWQYVAEVTRYRPPHSENRQVGGVELTHAEKQEILGKQEGFAQKARDSCGWHCTQPTRRPGPFPDRQHKLSWGFCGLTFPEILSAGLIGHQQAVTNQPLQMFTTRFTTDTIRADILPNVSLLRVVQETPD